MQGTAQEAPRRPTVQLRLSRVCALPVALLPGAAGEEAGLPTLGGGAAPAHGPEDRAVSQ